VKKFICVILVFVLALLAVACGKEKGNYDDSKKSTGDISFSDGTALNPGKKPEESLINLDKDCKAVIETYVQSEAELDAEKLYALLPQIVIDGTIAELNWTEDDILNAMKKEMSYFSTSDMSYEIIAVEKADETVIQKYNNFLAEHYIYKNVYKEAQHKVTEAYILDVYLIHRHEETVHNYRTDFVIIKENGIWKSAREYMEFDSFSWSTGFHWKEENDAIKNGESQTTVNDTSDDSYTATYQEAIDKYFEAVIDEDTKKFFSLVPQVWIDNITLLAEDDTKAVYNMVSMRLDEYSDNLDMSNCVLTHQIAGYYQVNQDVINEYNEFFSRCYKDSYNKEKHEIDDAYIVKVFWKAEKKDGELVACDMHIFAVIKENDNWKIASEFDNQGFNWSGGNDSQ